MEADTARKRHTTATASQDAEPRRSSLRGLTLLTGDASDVLRQMPDASVQCVVTSPPYWGLRDYGDDDQLGLESDPDLYVARLCGILDEARRVLRDDGTLWLNIGDTYTGGGRGGTGDATTLNGPNANANASRATTPGGAGLPPKSLVGVPWRVALELQRRAWVLRSEIIWRKPAPMPESATDRPTRAHEQIFLLAKTPRYFFDQHPIREPKARAPEPRAGRTGVDAVGPMSRAGSGQFDDAAQSRVWGGGEGGRNARTVWDIPPSPIDDAHFAAFPVGLPERCIKAATSERGACVKCGAPFRRVVSSQPIERDRPTEFTKRTGQDGTGNVCANTVDGATSRTLGYVPTCSCDGDFTIEREPRRPTGARATGVAIIAWRVKHDLWMTRARGLCGAAAALAVRPCVVLDPFAGTGTTLGVAMQLGRAAIGIELNAEYARLASSRVERMVAPSTRRDWSNEDGPLFTGSIEEG